MKITQQKITPFLWFNNNAKEAAEFYTGIFDNSRITNLTRYSEGAPMPAGTVMTVAFELDGQKFTALNGGPHFKFNPSVSFVISCNDQKEIDHYWNSLSADPKQEQCGWLVDKFGLSWQVIPSNLGELLSKDKERSGRVMAALMKMKKLVIADLENA
jgi:predicted 3-demethylubiquinone-9 3-methyltransferase (glyoxalase superfamily)